MTGSSALPLSRKDGALENVLGSLQKLRNSRNIMPAIRGFIGGKEAVVAFSPPKDLLHKAPLR